jgi:hypothetical protein
MKRVGRRERLRDEHRRLLPSTHATLDVLTTMALLPEFATYADENDFVQRFLVPLLGRLGFGIVVNHHGQSEAGMDLIIGEIDRFAHVRYHGLQAKFEGSIGKAACHGLVQDATEAFAAEFVHPQTGARQRISCFYAVNAGAVSDDARSLFFSLLQSKHGDNVKLLEGRDLLALDRSAAIRGESTRNVLVALLMETRRIAASLNRLQPRLQAIVDGDGNGVVYPVERLRLVAIEAWLAGPVLVSKLPVKQIEDLQSFGSAFNRSLDEAGSSPMHTVVSIKVPAAKALRLLPQVAAGSTAVEAAIAGELALLGPLSAL